MIQTICETDEGISHDCYPAASGTDSSEFTNIFFFLLNLLVIIKFYEKYNKNHCVTVVPKQKKLY